MSRVKRVFPTDEVAHLFAHKHTEDARNPNDNLFVSGNTIYSYGSHFPIASHISNKKHENALLFTTRGYSNTTAKHLSIVRSACSHLNIIYCNNPKGEHEDNLEAFHKSIEYTLKGLTNARKPERYIEPAKDTFNELKKYCEFFSIKVPKRTEKIISSAENGEYKEYLQKEAKRIAAEIKRKEKKKLEMFKETLIKWRENKSDRIYNNPTGFDFLRHNGKRIETSQGVEIPIEIAKKAYKFICSTIKNGGCSDGECNYKILDYDVKEVSNDFLRIGCHNISMTEINNLAQEMNWK